MKTAVRRVLLMSALMAPGALYALGLGEIKLNSALNQPFDAEIELVSATQEDLGALRAALASNDTFTRYGLDRPAYLADFSFRVAKGSGGQDVLRVTSPRPVTEPFVTLVEANWPRGRLLREYTVLLDPPVYAPGPAAATGGGCSARQFGRGRRRPGPDADHRNVSEPVRATSAASSTSPRRASTGEHLPGPPARHAVGDRERRQPRLALGCEPGDGFHLPEQPAGVRQQHQHPARREHVADSGRQPDPCDLGGGGFGGSRASVRCVAQRHKRHRRGHGSQWTSSW